MKTVSTVSDLIKCNYLRQNVPARLRDGEFRYLVNGMWIDEDAFNTLYPVAIYRKDNGKGQNPCRKNSYIHNNKSY